MNTCPIVTIIIKNHTGEFFVHQRNSNKKTFPNEAPRPFASLSDVVSSPFFGVVQNLAEAESSHSSTGRGVPWFSAKADKYGIGAGGHVDDGESNDKAASRELREETFLITPVKYLFNINYQDSESNYPVYVYETISDRDIKTDQSEWQWSGWLTKAEVEKLMLNNELCPDTAQFFKKYLNEFTL